MKSENIILSSNCDGVPISIQINIPEGNVKGIFQMAHGMEDHKERYEHFLEYICNQGFVTIISDHRGHGHSVKDEEDLGYFYDKTGTFIVEDLHQVSLYIKERFPGKELYLLGHSMGSLVARNYIQKYDTDIDKLIVCGSPSYNDSVGFGISLCKFLTIFQGERHHSTFFQKMTLGTYNRDFKKEGKNAWLCSNKEALEANEKDPLCNFAFTLNGFLNLFLLMRNTYNKKLYKVNNKNLDILFISGADDRVFGSVKKWYESQVFLKELGYMNISSKLYDNYRHEILNETNNQNVCFDIVEFISK